MRAIRYHLSHNEDAEALLAALRAGTVDALYKDPRSLLIGSAAAFASALITAWMSGDVVLYLCTAAILAVSVARGLDFRARARRRAAGEAVGAARMWERRYLVGAAGHVALLGLWCLACFVRSSDPAIHLLSFALALAYLVGVSGRNFASRPLVNVLIACAGIPMTAALLVAGPAYYPVIAFVLLPLFVALKLVSERLRSVFLDALVSSRQVGRLASQLDATLENMPHGACMFDAAQRVVVSNNRYAEIYGLKPDQVRPGTHLREIIDRRVARGLFAGSDPEAYMRDRLARVVGETQALLELSDGRTILVTRRALGGGGWVSTHQDVTEQRRSEARIAHMAHHDALTGLPNRVLLNERLQEALGRIQPGEMVVAHLLDLDLFKNVNDTLGHAAGDTLLQQVSVRLQGLMRETDTIARMGGDEFALLQIRIRALGDATALAQRVIDAVAVPFPVEGREVTVATSIGLAVARSDDVPTSDQLLRNADLALYRAKEAGRGTFRIFEPEMDRQLRERSDIERDLRNALARGEIELHYQPIICLQDSEICRFEALMRWRHPVHGLLPPGRFIPIAEQTGLIVPLGEWAIREACAAASRWPAHIGVAVNLSPRQMSGTGLVPTVMQALSASGLTAGRLELEITETSLLQDNNATVALLHRLRELGVSIAMDDFGTGYSSLSYLQSFPFDRIKIDRVFIRDLAESAGSLNIVRAVVALAGGLGMATTAEGVETREQLDILAWERCTEAQGFLLGRPRPRSEIDAMLAAGRVAKTAQLAS